MAGVIILAISGSKIYIAVTSTFVFKDRRFVFVMCDITPHTRSGNLLTVKDVKNNITPYKYDHLNRPTVTIYPDGTNQTKN